MRPESEIFVANYCRFCRCSRCREHRAFLRKIGFAPRRTVRSLVRDAFFNLVCAFDQETR